MFSLVGLQPRVEATYKNRPRLGLYKTVRPIEACELGQADNQRLATARTNNVFHERPDPLARDLVALTVDTAEEALT